MYHVLIVDDEAPARELLKLKIDWTSINCNVIGTAKNGQEALDFYIANKPDLVITDIEMPVMNGLKLIESIKALNSEQPIIILSCHESFSFARKAIKLGVNDYLIKDSFETEELYAIISDMFKNGPIVSPLEKAQRSTNEDKHKSAILKALVFDGLSKKLQEDYINRYHLNLIGKQMILLFLDLEILGQDISKMDDPFMLHKDIQLVQEILRNALRDFALGEVCHDKNNDFLVIYGATKSYSQEETRREAITISNHLRHEINKNLPVQTTIGISAPFNSLDNLFEAYTQASQSVQRKIVSGYDKSYLYSNKANIEEDQYIKILNVKLNRINDYLNAYKFDPMIKEINDIFLQNLKGFMQYNYLKHTNWTLLSLFIEFCSKNSLSFIDVCHSRSPWEVIMDIKTVDGMCTWFIGVIEEMKVRLQPTQVNTYSYHVEKCTKYIHQHYGENISPSDLSDMFDINNAYLSRIFKKETGSSITDYINSVRIEESKSLIQNTNKKMYEIAELTGFSSTQRFFLIFKKMVGCAPGDFRKT
ncbi:MAG: response regulator [Vallitaleaceae bacterium]|nr:response regulator [Vallitaleaceae bacterium]